jgi:hypothetical protein
LLGGQISIGTSPEALRGEKSVLPGQEHCSRRLGGVRQTPENQAFFFSFE